MNSIYDDPENKRRRNLARPDDRIDGRKADEQGREGERDQAPAEGREQDRTPGADRDDPDSARDLDEGADQGEDLDQDGIEGDELDGQQQDEGRDDVGPPPGDEQEQDQAQRPEGSSGPAPGLNPGGSGESRWNDERNVKDAIHYYSEVRGNEREAQQQQEATQARADEEKDMHDQAEAIERDRAGAGGEIEQGDNQAQDADPEEQRRAEYRARGEATEAKHDQAMTEKDAGRAQEGQEQAQDQAPAGEQQPAQDSDPEARRQAEYRARAEASEAKHEQAMADKEAGRGQEQTQGQDIDR